MFPWLQSIHVCIFFSPKLKSIPHKIIVALRFRRKQYNVRFDLPSVHASCWKILPLNIHPHNDEVKNKFNSCLRNQSKHKMPIKTSQFMHQSFVTTAPHPPPHLRGRANVRGSDFSSFPAVPGKCRADICKYTP